MSPRVSRPSARVIVVDDTVRVLLFRVEDLLQETTSVWITPGGGIEAGESMIGAAVRELAEETGLVVSPSDLGEPIAVCRGEWMFRGRQLYSVDSFFSLRVPRFDVMTDGWTELERELHADWRWWTPDELDATEEAVLPAGLADLVRRIGSGRIPIAPIELPWIAYP